MKPYRPSNGTEGMLFMSTWCDRCEHDRAFREDTGDSCPIIANSLAYDIDDPRYPEELVERDDIAGCLAFDAAEFYEPPPYRCPHTPDLFDLAKPSLPENMTP